MFDATPRITDLDLHMDQLADLVRCVGGVVERTCKADRLTVAYPKVPLCLFILVFFFSTDVCHKGQGWSNAGRSNIGVERAVPHAHFYVPPRCCRAIGFYGSKDGDLYHALET